MRILTNKAGRGSEIRDMAWKDTMLYSILGFKCPYCHTGDFFVSHPYDLRHTGDVHDHCGHCGRRFNIEPGFYYGAMYVSYAIGVAAMVTVFVFERAFLAIHPPGASDDLRSPDGHD